MYVYVCMYVYMYVYIYIYIIWYVDCLTCRYVVDLLILFTSFPIFRWWYSSRKLAKQHAWHFNLRLPETHLREQPSRSWFPRDFHKRFQPLHGGKTSYENESRPAKPCLCRNICHLAWFCREKIWHQILTHSLPLNKMSCFKWCGKLTR